MRKPSLHFWILLCVLGTNVTQAVVKSDIEPECLSRSINVLSFVNLDSEVGSAKKTLDGVPSLAVLENAPRDALPGSFTICSDIMTTFSSKSPNVMFFNLLARNGEPCLWAMRFNGNLFTTRVASGQIPTIFPNQWVRSCMAIDTVSGMINWVVDGKLIESNTNDILKNSTISKNLSGKIILGAVQLPTRSWFVLSNKLTNLNVFSTLQEHPEPPINHSCWGSILGQSLVTKVVTKRVIPTQVTSRSQVARKVILPAMMGSVFV